MHMQTIPYITVIFLNNLTKNEVKFCWYFYPDNLTAHDVDRSLWLFYCFIKIYLYIDSLGYNVASYLCVRYALWKINYIYLVCIINSSTRLVCCIFAWVTSIIRYTVFLMALHIPSIFIDGRICIKMQALMSSRWYTRRKSSQKVK